MHRNHVSEIVGAGVDAPAIPIEEQDNVLRAILGQKAIPDVGVALNDRDVAMGLIALDETGSSGEQPIIKVASLTRQTIADAIVEPLQFGR